MLSAAGMCIFVRGYWQAHCVHACFVHPCCPVKLLHACLIPMLPYVIVACLSDSHVALCKIVACLFDSHVALSVCMT